MKGSTLLFKSPMPTLTFSFFAWISFSTSPACVFSPASTSLPFCGLCHHLFLVHILIHIHSLFMIYLQLVYVYLLPALHKQLTTEQTLEFMQCVRHHSNQCLLAVLLVFPICQHQQWFKVDLSPSLRSSIIPLIFANLTPPVWKNNTVLTSWTEMLLSKCHAISHFCYPIQAVKDEEVWREWCRQIDGWTQEDGTDVLMAWMPEGSVDGWCREAPTAARPLSGDGRWEMNITNLMTFLGQSRHTSFISFLKKKKIGLTKLETLSFYMLMICV